MFRIVEIGLISAIVLAVLAFGGTEPLYFSVVQILLLGLGILLVLSYGTSRIGKPSLPIAIPLFLVALVLLQIVPFSASVVQPFGSAANLASDTSSATVSIDPYQTLTHFLLLLTYVAAFYLTLAVCQRRERMKHLISALLAIGAFEAFYGIVQYLTGSERIFTYVRVFPMEAAAGTYINRNHFAGLLEMIVPFALALMFYQFGKLQQAPSPSSARAPNLFGHAELQKLIFWLFLTVVLFVAVVFSRSRMGIISALVSTFWIVTLTAASTRYRRTGTVLAILLFLTAGVSLVIWIGPEPVISRFEALGQEYALTNQGRLAIWQDALQLIDQQPWIGSGFGTFPLAYTSAQTVYLNMFVNHAHNDYLEVVAELGLLGGLLLLGSVFYLLAQTIRRYLITKGGSEGAIVLGSVGSMVAILLHSLTDFNLYIPANALLFSMILGLCYSVIGDQRRLPSAEHWTPGAKQRLL